MNGMKKQDRTRRITVSGLLLALMLVLGFFESRIPLNLAVPGVRLGLSNSVLIFAVYMLDLPAAWCLMCLKVLLSGLLFSGVAAMAYAFAGGALSLTVMCLLSRIRKIPVPVVSMAGGLFHNVGQVAMAMLMLNTKQLFSYMLVLMPVGLACGALTGICAGAVIRHLKALGWKTASAKNGRKLPVILLAALLAVTVAVLTYVSQPKTDGGKVTVTITDAETE